MPNCTEDISATRLDFGHLGRRVIEGRFDGGNMTSDGGVMLLAALDKRLGLMDAAARAIVDPREPSSITHSIRDMFRQRVYGLVQGWEDLNNHTQLRRDIAYQTAVGRDDDLASAPTLCRLEKLGSRAAAVKLHQVLVDQFIASFKSAPEELILDFDATDCPLYGKQEDRFFHGYYDSYCYLPLYVFCGEQMLAAYLRPSKIDGAKHAAAILKLLVTRLRQVWPSVRIIFRADSGFCRQKILNWCDRKQVQYVIGLARNKRLQGMVTEVEAEMNAAFEDTGIKQRRLVELVYGARTWKAARRCVARLEFGEQGNNPRFVVTNISLAERDAAQLYDQLYCQRGEAENRIKEAQLGLFATRTSCQYFNANQFRILLSALAYTLVERLRALALKDTPLANAQIHTLRNQLLKLAAVITRNTRRIRLYLASHWPSASIFKTALHALNSG
jgi:Transposase DDE domain group 1